MIKFKTIITLFLTTTAFIISAKKSNSEKLRQALIESVYRIDRTLPDSLLENIFSNHCISDAMLNRLSTSGDFVLVGTKSDSVFEGILCDAIDNMAEGADRLFIDISNNRTGKCNNYSFKIAYDDFWYDYYVLNDIILLYARNETYSIPNFIVRQFQIKNDLSELDDIKVIKILRDGDVYNIQEHKISVDFSN